MRRARRTTLVAAGCGAAIVGVVYARASYSSLALIWLLLALPFLVVAFVSKRSALALASICFFGFMLGWFQAGRVLYRLADYERIYGEKIVLLVKADSDGAYTDDSQMIFDASHIELVEPVSHQLIGRISVAGFGTSDIRRGDRVEVEGKIFPTLGGKQGRMSFAQMKVKSRSGSVVEKIRRKFLASLRTTLPEPQASFGAGLLIGQTRELPADYVDVLRIVGLSHIIAVSGYNLTILANLLGKRAGRRSKFRGMVLSLLFIGVFVLLAGTSASIARAAVVSVLIAVAGYYGRRIKPVPLILLVAAGSALLNPLNAWGDVGWYLSFLAFFGVLVLAPILQKSIWKKREPKLLAQIAVESFSAQIMTLPYILYIFHQLSTVSLISNLIVLPLIPIAMLLTTVAGIAGLLPMPLLALLLAWPAALVLRAILDVSVLFSRIPHASVTVLLPVAGALAAYLTILVLMHVLSRYRIQKTEVMVK